MLYNHEKNLRTTEERVRNSNTSEANKQVIFEYESYCFAQGLKVVRVIKHLMQLVPIIVPRSEKLNIFRFSCRSNQPHI